MISEEFSPEIESRLRKMAADGTSVLVTGGSGYLGSMLVEMLVERGFKTTVVDNLAYGQNSLFNLFASGKLEFIHCDVTNEAFVKELMEKGSYDYIVPLAAIVGFPASEQRPEATWLVNHGSILTLLKYRKNGQKIIFPGSNSSYGTVGATGEICTEESPLNPISTYGKTKIAAEKAVLDSGDAISFRIATLFGFSQRMRTESPVNNLVLKASTDKTVVLSEHRSYKRNFLHVRDGARVFLWGMANWDKLKNGVYNVVLPDGNVSKEEIVALIRKQMPGLNVCIAERDTDSDLRNYSMSCDKIVKAGFTFKYTLESGITELINGYRAFRDYRFKNY
ncbi:GDP-L-fucose synthase [uncultured archaeon]|nr:GDP-L-fucose synthase [uncultured archaeon]